jgi:hypothetical protein
VNFPAPPVDLTVLKTNTDRLSALIAASRDGSKTVIAEKNKQKDVVVKMLRLLARYVEVNCQDEMAIFMTSGFDPASTTKVKTPSLSEKIRKIKPGPNSGQIAVWVQASPEAAAYGVRSAAVGSGGAPPAWTTKTVVMTRAPVTFEGLTAGTMYEFQVRILTKDGYSDWSDSVTFMCT